MFIGCTGCVHTHIIIIYLLSEWNRENETENIEEKEAESKDDEKCIILCVFIVL